MPRFRNTSTSVATDVPHLDDPLTKMIDSSCLPRWSQVARDLAAWNFDEPCITNTLCRPTSSMPTPSPSPVSLPEPLPSFVPTSPAKSPKRKHASRAHDANHIPRPRNAFIIFRSHALATGLVGTTQQNEASREIGRIWRDEIDAATKKVFEDRAAVEKKRHAEAHPNYKYAPKKIDGSTCREREMGGHGRTGGTGRKGRNVQPRLASVRFSPVSTRARRTLLTPDSTPEPSPTLSPALLEAEQPKEHMNTDQHVESNGPLFNMFGGIFNSLPIVEPQPAELPDISIPDFTFPFEEPYTIDQGRVPCLASSAYYKPTSVYAGRRLSLPSSSALLASDAEDLVRRAVRPFAPLWNLEATWRYWEEPGHASSLGVKPFRLPLDAVEEVLEPRTISMFFNDSF